MAVSNPSPSIAYHITKGLIIYAGRRLLNRVLSNATSPRYDSSTGGRRMYVCDLCSTRLACHSNTLHETSLTHAHLPAIPHDLSARACLPCRRRLFSKAHFTTACLAPKSKAFQSYEATWGIAPHCYCPTLPSEPTHLHLHHPTQNSDSDSHTPVPRSPSHVHRRSPPVATPAVRPPPNCPPERSEAPGPELRRRRWAMSGADSTMGRLYT